MTWNLLQTNWPFKDENIRIRTSKERFFVDYAGVTVFEGSQEQCRTFQRQNPGSIFRHYVGTSEEMRAKLREEKRFQYTGSGTKQTIKADPEPGIIHLNSLCYKRRKK